MQTEDDKRVFTPLKKAASFRMTLLQELEVSRFIEEITMIRLHFRFTYGKVLTAWEKRPMNCIISNSMLRPEWLDKSLTGRRAYFVSIH
jgi:hypothetical protein